MVTRTTALRVLFLFTAFLAYSRPSDAAEADWYEQCNSHCEGHIMVTECDFWDVGYGNGYDAGSVCSFFECLTINCTGSTETPYPYYEAMCSGWAHGAGVGGTEYVNFPACWGYDGAVEGSFYCSYMDVANCY